MTAGQDRLVYDGSVIQIIQMELYLGPTTSHFKLQAVWMEGSPRRNVCCEEVPGVMCAVLARLYLSVGMTEFQY